MTRGGRTWILRASARWRIAAASLGLATACIGAGAGAATGLSARRVLDGSDTARLHLVHLVETLLFEEGAAKGDLAGRMRAELNIGQTYTGNFTIDTPNGRIAGRGTARPHGYGRYQSFAGTLVVTGGSGLYVHVRGRAGLYGVFDRRAYSVTLQTTGKLSY